MAVNIPIVTEFVDKGLKSAEGAFNNFRMKVGEAEGGMAKFKAGGNAALDAVKANAGQFAMAAGAAIAGFAIKAVGDFQELALEVDKFSNSTGLAAEEASRWVEVAGDIGIESGTLLGVFNRLNKAVGENSSAFQELGVEVVRTSTGATDVNATFLKTVDALRKVEDPAKRAELATKLLGRGWTEVSELVEMGSTKLTAALEDVAGAKIIDEREIQKAKDLRAAQDALGDAFDELVLTVGEDLIPAFTNAVAAAEPLVDIIGTLTRVTVGQTKADASYGEQVSNNNISLRIAATAWDWLSKKIGLNSDEVEDNVEVSEDQVAIWRDGTRALINAQYELEGTNDLINGQATLVEDLEYAWQELLGELNQREAWRNLNDRFEDANRKMAEVFGQKGPEAIAQIEEALDEQIGAIARFVRSMEKMIPDDVEVQIITLLNQGKVNEAKALLEKIFGKPIYQDIIPNPFTPGALAPRAAGGMLGGDGGRNIGAFLPGAKFTPGLVKEGTSVINSPNFAGETEEERKFRKAMEKALREGLLAVGGTADKRGQVTVNVQGSVISEKELVSKIRRGLVDSQRNGAQLMYENA